VRYTFSCGDVMADCEARFESADRDELLSEIARHIADVHGITEITPDVLDAVTSKIVVQD
jgi:predicted small metal-binding protein